MSITRRRLIATAGGGVAAAGAGTVLAACGGDGRPERTAERDAGLLQAALTAEATLSGVYDLATEQALAPQVAAAVTAFGEQSREHVALLSSQIEEAGGAADDSAGPLPAGESVVEAIRVGIEESIAASHDVVGELSTIEARHAVYRVMVADAAQLAAIRGVLGEQQVPVAFVTGAPEPPLAVEPEDRESEDGS